MLSPEQRRDFAEHGLLRLSGAVDAALAGGLRERVCSFLAERRLAPEPAVPGSTVHASRTAPLARTLGFRETWGARATGVLDELLGAGGWQLPPYAGQLLAMTTPLPGGAWRLPHKSWHLDYPAPAALRGLPGVQLFLCLDRVEPRGGATLVAAGIHRLVDALRRRRPPDWPGRSEQVRRELAREVPWLSALLSERPGEDRAARFMGEPTLFAGVPLRVVSLSGEAGDVLAVHPWLLHAASPSCGERPRMVLTERVRSAVRPSTVAEPGEPAA